MIGVNKTKKFRQEVTGYKRSILLQGPGTSEKTKKRTRQVKTTLQKRDIGPYNLRPRVKKAAESKSSRGEMHDQGRPLLSRGRRFQQPRPTTRIQATGSSLDTRVVKSRNRSLGVDNQVGRIHNEAEEPNSKNARRLEESQRAEGLRR
ncbi:hypothetical protein TNIN_200431 [Trichonephila inaurata madagascariensis]|uniref:Uncharacterized protein n=1 Tax=Trichonephila inaurata madagascariensis TaxID=2747483 RepID=A0A8X6YHB7_9ARAC|nr:hypothetical protein TNIN_200431 [Trichonephila inaurata madagascariensis]